MQGSYQLAITTEGMIADIVRHLRSSNADLKQQCSMVIFKCATDKVRRLKFTYSYFIILYDIYILMQNLHLVKMMLDKLVYIFRWLVKWFERLKD